MWTSYTLTPSDTFLKLHHKIYGAGEVVVILHGLFGMSDNWKSIASKLADTYLVVLIDLPNHGRSPRLATFDIPTVVDKVHAFLTDHWMYEIRLIGHSLGAKVAMTFAQHHPDMVDKLVSVDMGPQSYKPGHNAIFNALCTLDLDAIKTRQQAFERLATQIPREDVRLFLLKNLKRTQNGFVWKFDLPTLRRDYPNILSGIDDNEVFENPTLFIRGDEADYLDYERDGDLIRKIFPAAELKTIEKAGHWVHADQPQALEHMLRTFLY